MKKVKISVFADPACTWCWGSVPVVRALRYRYGAQLEFEYVMGGMIEDITSFNNRRLSIGGDIAMSNRNMHKHWLEASAIHGMPVSETPIRLFTEEHRSTVPMNLAYIAAKLYEGTNDTAIDNASQRYLRILQEMTQVDGAQTNVEENIVAMSALVGFNKQKFSEIFAGPEVKRIYSANRELCKEYDVHSFPTYKLVYADEEMMVRGFTTYETLAHCIAQLSYENVKPVDDGREALTIANVRTFIEELGTAYPVEIATAFSLERTGGHTALNIESYSGLPDIVEEMIKSGDIAMAPKGNGFMLYTLKRKQNASQVKGREYAGVY